MCRGGGGHKWTAVKVLREPRLPLCPPKQTQLESQNQTQSQSQTERSCRAVVVANSAWSMHRDGTTQAVQVVPKVAAGNTVAVLHKCPSRSPSPNPSCSSSCSGQSAPLATRILSPLPCPPPPPPPPLWPVIICVPSACCCGGCLFN